MCMDLNKFCERSFEDISEDLMFDINNLFLKATKYTTYLNMNDPLSPNYI